MPEPEELEYLGYVHVATDLRHGSRLMARKTTKDPGGVWTSL